MTFSSIWDNKTSVNKAHIRHLCMKATVLSCHRCQINNGVEKWTFKYRLEFWPLDLATIYIFYMLVLNGKAKYTHSYILQQV